MTEVIEFKDNEEKRLLIDGDVLIHMACWQKPISIQKQEEIKEEISELKEFGKFKEAAKLEVKLAESLLTYQPTIEKAQNRFEHFLNYTKESNYSEVFSMAIGNSEDNWRKEIHPAYKLQKGRSDVNKKRAPYIQELREWAIETFNGHYCEGYEADDAIRMWATRLGIGNYVVCSVDKDLNLVPGHHFDPKTEDNDKKFWYIEPEDSAMFFWEQMLTGDSIDNIPGIYGIGPKKAAAILEPCKTEQDCKEVVVQQYDLKYGGDGYKELMFNGQLLHIWKHKGDKWSFDPKEYEEITGTKPVIGT